MPFHCNSQGGPTLRKLLQFRLRTLFALVTLAALAALWWSHRLHCLDRVEFHRSEIARCQEQEFIELEAILTANARLRPGDLEIAALNERVAVLQRQLAEDAELAAKLERQGAELTSRIAELELLGTPRGASQSQRWEDQSIYDSMAQGYLVVPAPGANMFSRPSAHAREDLSPETTNQRSGEPDALDASIVPASEPPKAVEQESEEPDLVAPYEAKAAALSREILIHTEFADKYLRAIYRPWMRVDENAISGTKDR